MPHYRHRGPYRKYMYPAEYYYMSSLRPQCIVYDGIKYCNGVPVRKGLRRFRPIW